MKIPVLPGFDQQAFQKYLRNTGWLITARMGSLFLKMIITAVALPNYLGAEQNGVLNYPLVLVTFFVAIAALGMDSMVTRQLLQQPDRQPTILGTAFRLRLVAGFAVLPLIYLTYKLIETFASRSPAAPFEYVGIVSLICIFQSVNIIDNYFQARTEGKYIMYVQIGGNLLSAVLKLLLILLQAPLIWFVWMLALDVLLLSLGYLLVYKRRGGKLGEWRFDGSTARVLLHYSWPLAFSAFFVSLYMKIDQLMIDAYLGKVALGVYTPVVNLSEAWYFVPMAIVTSVFPAIMNARRDDPLRYRRRLQNLYELMISLGLVVAIVMTFAAPWIYEWFYKPEFHAGAKVLAIHIWAGIFISLNVANGQYLIAEGYTRLLFIRSLLGAGVNIALNAWWIPDYGMVGAAYATVVAYACSAFFVIFVPKTREQGLLMLASLTFVPMIRRMVNKRN